MIYTVVKRLKKRVRDRPSTTEPCICCRQVAENPREEHLKIYVQYMQDVCKYAAFRKYRSSTYIFLCFVKVLFSQVLQFSQELRKAYLS